VFRRDCKNYIRCVEGLWNTYSSTTIHINSYPGQ